jgi:hypothetical protein
MTGKNGRPQIFETSTDSLSQSSRRGSNRKGFMWRYYYTMRENRYSLYSKALEYFGKYDSKLDPRLKLEFSLIFLTLGFVGFAVMNKFYILNNNFVDLYVWTRKCHFYVLNLLRPMPFNSIMLSED